MLQPGTAICNPLYLRARCLSHLSFSHTSLSLTIFMLPLTSFFLSLFLSLFLSFLSRLPLRRVRSRGCSALTFFAFRGLRYRVPVIRNRRKRTVRTREGARADRDYRRARGRKYTKCWRGLLINFRSGPGRNGESDRSSSAPRVVRPCYYRDSLRESRVAL